MSELLFSITTDDSANLMELTISGKLSRESAINLVTTAAKMQGQRDNYNRLYNLSDVEVDVGVSEFNEILSKAKEVVYREGKMHKVAFVSPDPDVQVLLDIYKVNSEKFQFHQVDWFASRQEAKEWLLE